MSSNYVKIFSGSSIEAIKIVASLEEKGIRAIIKDRAESARLAGFGASPFYQELFVRKEEEYRSMEIIKSLKD